MKRRLHELLICPSCLSMLDLTVLDRERVKYPNLRIQETRCRKWCSYPSDKLVKLKANDAPRPCMDCYGDEITRGALHCRECGRHYPIADGIPRFLPDSQEIYKDILREYEKVKNQAVKTSAEEHDLKEFQRLHGNTRASYSKEWLTYTRLESDEENIYLLLRWTGREKEFFKDKLTVDCGCGGGRYTRIAAMLGAEVVGLDLGEGVRQAQRLNADFPFTYFVQGNVMQPPLARDTFDFAFSVGVLMTTPSTHDSLLSISRLPRPGGDLSVWVYPTDWLTTPIITPKLPRFEFFNKRFRTATLKMPHWYVDFLSRVLAVFPLIPGSEKIQQMFSIHPYRDVRIQQNFDWYSPQYQFFHTNDEVAAWFREAGYTDITINEPLPVSVKGKKPAVTAAKSK